LKDVQAAVTDLAAAVREGRVATSVPTPPDSDPRDDPENAARPDEIGPRE